MATLAERHVVVSDACMHAGGCRRDAFTLDMMEIPQGAGSGFVWDTKGHIVTNYHVIKGASDLQVRAWPLCSYLQ